VICDWSLMTSTRILHVMLNQNPLYLVSTLFFNSSRLICIPGSNGHVQFHLQVKNVKHQCGVLNNKRDDPKACTEMKITNPQEGSQKTQNIHAEVNSTEPAGLTLQELQLISEFDKLKMVLHHPKTKFKLLDQIKMTRNKSPQEKEEGSHNKPENKMQFSIHQETLLQNG
jgi:hypothetical protein